MSDDLSTTMMAGIYRHYKYIWNMNGSLADEQTNIDWRSRDNSSSELENFNLESLLCERTIKMEIIENEKKKIK